MISPQKGKIAKKVSRLLLEWLYTAFLVISWRVLGFWVLVTSSNILGCAAKLRQGLAHNFWLVFLDFRAAVDFTTCGTSMRQNYWRFFSAISRSASPVGARLRQLARQLATRKWRTGAAKIDWDFERLIAKQPPGGRGWGMPTMANPMP